MGNKTSNEKRRENLNMYLTPRQRLLVQANLDYLKDNLSDLGLVVFVRLVFFRFLIFFYHNYYYI